MARITWLADGLRHAGLEVVEHAGWRTREVSGSWKPRYGVVHATAAPRHQSDMDQARIVRDGRADLNGPIANACVSRDGVWHVLAAGRCNTTLAGTAGPFRGMGNTYALGVEACNDNGLHQPAEPWPSVQYRSYARGWAAICRRLGWTPANLVGHKEHTPGRKTDPTFSMTKFRADVAGQMRALEDDMPTAEELLDSDVVPNRPWRPDYPDNPRVRWEYAVTNTWDQVRDVNVKANEIKATLAALLGAMQGLDTAAILARIDEHAAVEAQRDAALLTLVEAHAAGSLDAEAVVRRIGELLTGATPTGG